MIADPDGAVHNSKIFNKRRKRFDNSAGFLGKLLEIMTTAVRRNRFAERSRIMSQAPTTFEEWWVGSYYRRFVESEGVPLYEGSILEDLATLPLGDWERRGGKAAYTRLGDQEEVNLQIVEIPPKAH